MQIKTKEFHSITAYKVFEKGERVRFENILTAPVFTVSHCIEPAFPDDCCTVFVEEHRYGLDSVSLIPA